MPSSSSRSCLQRNSPGEHIITCSRECDVSLAMPKEMPCEHIITCSRECDVRLAVPKEMPCEHIITCSRECDVRLAVPNGEQVRRLEPPPCTDPKTDLFHPRRGNRISVDCGGLVMCMVVRWSGDGAALVWLLLLRLRRWQGGSTTTATPASPPSPATSTSSPSKLCLDYTAQGLYLAI